MNADKLHKLTDTGALGALVSAARLAGYYEAATAAAVEPGDGLRTLHKGSIERREALWQDMLRRLRERRERK